MALSKDEVIKMAKLFLDSLRQRHDVRQAYLFGSFARGMEREYSDVDLAIVLGTFDKSKDAPFGEDFEIFHEAQQYDSRLEVVCFAQEEFNLDNAAIIRHIKKEGIKLA